MTEEEKIKEEIKILVTHIKSIQGSVTSVVLAMEEVDLFNKDLINLAKMDLYTGFRSLIKSTGYESPAGEYFSNLQ